MRVVSLLSGGIDSATLVGHLIDMGEEVHPVTFLYGQRHSREMQSAKDICAHYKLPFTLINLSSLGMFLKSALTSKDIKVPEVPETTEHYETLKATVVPNRNMILLSVAAGYALSLGAGAVAYAAHYSDRGVYPDCRPIFVDRFATALRVAMDTPRFEVLAPFIGMTKGQVVGAANELGVPLEKTWSCYKGEDLHCGVCSSCRERKRAFVEAGLEDPTKYKEV